MKHIPLHLFLTIAMLFVAAHCASAATITFRSEPVVCQGNAVTLGDVAYITPDANEAPDEIEKLKSIVLFPVPIAGKDRTIGYREIYDYLNMRGVRVGLHTFAGSKQVTVTAAKQILTQHQSDNEGQFVRRQTQSNVPENAENFATGAAEEAVRHAVVTFLKGKVADDVPWQVDVALSEADRRYVMIGNGTDNRNVGHKGIDNIGGIRWVFEKNRVPRTASQYDSAETWLGRQRFELQLKDINPETGMHRTMLVDVDISLPKAIVVTRHAIAKGKVISAADVKLHYITETQTPANVTKERTVNGVTTRRNAEPEIDVDIATRIDEVVGKAALRNLRSNMPVQLSLTDSPVMVQKSEIVTLFVRNGGITIKMMAKSKEDGKAGDIVTVESLSDKQTSLASVVDYGVVEIEMARPQTIGAAHVAQSYNAATMK